MAGIIDGKAIADEMVDAIAVEVASLGVTPGLAVVRVGEDPASAVYVRTKLRQCARAGMRSIERHLPAEVDEATLLAEIGVLNRDVSVDGILVQLPLPRTIDAARVLEAVDPAKDVDGFHVRNAGLLASGLPGCVPCTPLGCLILLQRVLPEMRGLEAVVIGRSNIVGKPMAALLLRQDCTVTVAHSGTRDLAGVVHRADIVVAAVGRPEMVRGDWIKPGAAVVDVGINRVTADTASGTRLVGDVAFDEAVAVAGWITPVPGGVGPMTVACLLRNTLDAARRRATASMVRDGVGRPMKRSSRG